MDKNKIMAQQQLPNNNNDKNSPMKINNEATTTNCQQRFPLELLIPKTHTQRDLFLKNFPTYDGRNVLIAVLDTGVDPAMPGMRITSDGKPKLVDCLDMTGAGYVDCSVVRSASPGDGTLVGLSGRKLKIPQTQQWQNPSGKYHLGIKPIYELYSKTLMQRIKLERKRELWDAVHSTCTAELLRRINVHEQEIGGTSEKLSDKDARDNLNYQLEFLKSIDKDEDLGPVADCIVYHDGQKWRAAIDTSYRGELSLCNVLTNFCDEHQFEVLSEKDLLSYCVNIQDDGNLLEICVPSSPHGSHVANIAAGNFPDCPEKNGIAPGAQVVSMCIGDHRLSSEETIQALIRAFNKCVDMGVDIVNYSYGETATFMNNGILIEAINKLVQRGVMFLSAAGNNGPALNTAGAPGATTSTAIGIGAYLATEMCQLMYNVLEEVPGMIYYWSSKGPTPDGALGVSLTAPGGAITGVPHYLLKGAELMNGTSMSCPNATGSIACLLSALKQSDLKHSLFSTRLALENTAVLPSDDSPSSDEQKLAYGHGMIQLVPAFDMLKNITPEYLPTSLYAIDIAVCEANANVCSNAARRGIYIREGNQLENSSQQKFSDFIVKVEPKFAENTDHNEKLNFEKHLQLKCDAPHVQHPKLFELANERREFQVRVDTGALQPGAVYYTEILALDTARPDAGPLFRVPITAIIPLTLTSMENFQLQREIQLQPGVPVRLFVHVPKGAAYAHYTIRSQTTNGRVAKFLLHCVQNLVDTRRRAKFCKLIIVEPGAEDQDYVPLCAEQTVEFCLAKQWTDPGTATVHLQLTFHGEKPTMGKQISFFSTMSTNCVQLGNELRYQEVAPAITFRQLCYPLRPTNAKVTALNARDLFLDGQQIFALKLDYSFNVSKPTEFTFEISGVNEYLYDSPFYGLGMQLFTSTKQFMGASNIFSERYNIKLEKGNDYRLQLQLNHINISFLDKFKDLSVLLKQKLAQPISDIPYVDIYAAISENGRKFGTVGLRPGQTATAYFAPIPEDKFPTGMLINAGAYLLGCLSLGKSDNEKLRRRVQYPVAYYLLDYSNNKKTCAKSTTAAQVVVIEKKKKIQMDKEQLAESLRDQEVQLFAKISDATFAEEFFNQLLAKYPTHLSLLLAHLKRLHANSGKAQNLPRATYNRIIEITAQIIEIAKPEEVQLFFGGRIENSEADLLIKKDMEKRKAAIIEAHIARCNAICDAHLRASTQEVPKIFRNGMFCEAEGTLPSANGKPVEEKEQTAEDTEEPIEDPDPKKDGEVKPDADDKEQEVADDGQEMVKNASNADLQHLDGQLSQEEFQQKLEEMQEEAVEQQQSTGQSEQEQPKSEKSTEEEEVFATATLQEVDEACTQLLKWISEDDNRALPIVAKRAVAHAHFGTALRALKKLADKKCYDGTLSAISMHTAMVELTDQLGWAHISARLRNAVLVKHRATYRPLM